MTALHPDGQEFVLHVDVAKRWWLWHLSHSDEATRFLLESVGSRTAQLIALEGVLSDLLRVVVDDLGPDLGSFVAPYLADDIIALFLRLQNEHLLHLVPREPHLRSAFLTASEYRVAFDDALTMTLAEDSGSPLLIADPALYQTLRAVERERPNLRLALLGDVLGR